VFVGLRCVQSSKALLSTEIGVNDEVCAEKRQAEAQRIRGKYPDRIPVSRDKRVPSCCGAKPGR